MKEESSRIEHLKNQVYSREEYAKANFWDQRYSENSGFFDWYAEYPELKHAFAQYNLSPSDRILMVGCGNSKLSYQMWEAGYKNMVSIDISPSVIQQMKKEFPDLEWKVMDATKMSYQNGQFDAIIDKGTLDALISGKNYDICEEMMKECMRVTKENGQIILITYGSPEGRRKIFQNALPFTHYDYYQCRAELNDMSTMINLMRSNVQGGLKDILNDKEALAKTMKQFSIIKMLRRRRINKKQFIIWGVLEKKQIQLNPTYLKNENPNQKKEVEQVHGEEEKGKVQKKEVIQSKFSYQPKKQSYVFVYSIRRKFAISLDQMMTQLTKESLLEQFNPKDQESCLIEGNEDLSPFNIYTDKSNFAPAFEAFHFLQQKHIQYPSCKLSTQYDNPLQQSLRLSLITSQQIKQCMLSLRKTNLKFKITVDLKRSTAEKVLNSLGKLMNQLVSVCDLYPCPKTYAMLWVLKKRENISSVNTLLEKYWFPTYQIISFSSESLFVKISIPPVQKEKEEEIIKVITTSIKFAKLQLTQNLQGFLSFFDLQLYNIVSMGILSYSGSKYELILEDFWEKDALSDSITSSQLVKSKQYIQLYSTVVLHHEFASKILAHILTFY